MPVHEEPDDEDRVESLQRVLRENGVGARNWDPYDSSHLEPRLRPRRVPHARVLWWGVGVVALVLVGLPLLAAGLDALLR